MLIFSPSLTSVQCILSDSGKRARVEESGATQAEETDHAPSSVVEIAAVPEVTGSEVEPPRRSNRIPPLTVQENPVQPKSTFERAYDSFVSSFS